MTPIDTKFLQDLQTKSKTKKGITLEELNQARDLMLKHFLTQTPETALMCVKINAYLFQFVRTTVETTEMGMIATRENPTSFIYVAPDKQTAEMAAIAIRHNPKLIDWVREDLRSSAQSLAQSIQLTPCVKKHFYDFDPIQ